MPHIKRLLQIQNDKAVYWSILLNSERVKRIFLFTKRIYNCFSSFGLLEYNILQTKQSIRNWTEFPLCLEHLQDRYLKQTEATSSRRTLYSPCCRKGRRTVRDPSVWSLSIRVLSSWGQSTHDNHFSEATTLNTYTLYVFIFNMNWGVKPSFEHEVLLFNVEAADILQLRDTEVLKRERILFPKSSIIQK